MENVAVEVGGQFLAVPRVDGIVVEGDASHGIVVEGKVPFPDARKVHSAVVPILCGVLNFFAQVWDY